MQWASSLRVTLSNALSSSLSAISLSLASATGEIPTYLIQDLLQLWLQGFEYLCRITLIIYYPREFFSYPSTTSQLLIFCGTWSSLSRMLCDCQCQRYTGEKISLNSRVSSLPCGSTTVVFLRHCYASNLPMPLLCHPSSLLAPLLCHCYATIIVRLRHCYATTIARLDHCYATTVSFLRHCYATQPLLSL